MLAKYKKGRAMLLTTHFMDEADLLSDSIAIMAGGWLKCWGTPLSLKQQYATGWGSTSCPTVKQSERGGESYERPCMVRKHIPYGRCNGLAAGAACSAFSVYIPRAMCAMTLQVYVDAEHVPGKWQASGQAGHYRAGQQHCRWRHTFTYIWSRDGPPLCSAPHAFHPALNTLPQRSK